MEYIKRIVCLANSLKLGGRCVAGKEIQEDGFGQWIRPISNTDNGELALQQIICQDRQIPQLLDVIRIPLKEYKPHGFQTENHLVNITQRWIRESPIKQTKLPFIVDNVKALWRNGYSSSGGLNDRIPLHVAEREVTSSLLFIKPRRVLLRTLMEPNGRKVRAVFNYNGVDHIFSVTDLVVRNELFKRKDGDYKIDTNDVYLCVSLGEPYNGFTYKLVAAIVNFHLP